MVLLHSILERGAKSTYGIPIAYLDDLSLYGQEVSGSLLRVEFGNILIYCISDPGVAILGVIEAYHA